MDIIRRRLLQAALTAPAALCLPGLARAALSDPSPRSGLAGRTILVGVPWKRGDKAALTGPFQVLIPKALQARPTHSRARDATILMRAANEELAAICARYPRHYAGLALLPGDPVEAVRELENAAALGLKGGVIRTALTGAGTSPGIAVYESAAALALPLYLDPLSAKEGLSTVRLRLLGIIHGGILDRFPGLNLIIAAGGDLQDWIRRLDYMEDKGVLTGMENLRQGRRLARRVTDFLRGQVHFTSRGMTGIETLRRAVATVGPCHVILDGDNPDFPDGIRSGLRIKEESMSRQFLHGNAYRLFNLAGTV